MSFWGFVFRVWTNNQRMSCPPKHKTRNPKNDQSGNPNPSCRSKHQTLKTKYD